MSRTEAVLGLTIRLYDTTHGSSHHNFQLYNK